MLSAVRRRRVALPDSGLEIALLDFGGEGPVALLHHANGFCAALWAPVAEPLIRHFRVIAMDARGHGDSGAPEDPEQYAWEHFAADARQVAQILAVEHGAGRVALGLGHSFGGTSLLGAAAAEPGLFDRLALVDPVLPALGPEDAQQRHAGGLALAEATRRRRAVWSSRAAARTRWARKELFADWQPRALELYLAEGLRDRPDGRVELKCSPQVEAAVFERGHLADVWSRASANRAPTLILWAQRGNFPRVVFEELAKRTRSADLRDVDCGHLVPMEDPQLVVREVLDFCGIDVVGG